MNEDAALLRRRGTSPQPYPCVRQEDVRRPLWHLWGVTHHAALLLLLPGMLAAYPLMRANKRLSGFVHSYFLPFSMKSMHGPLQALERCHVANAAGKVLDLGSADGQWLPLLVAVPGVTEIYAVEPNPALEGRLRARAAELEAAYPHISITVVCGFAEDLLAEHSGSFDTVHFGFMLCEAPQVQTIETGRSLLAPGGRILFCDHVRGDGYRGVLQDVVNPLWSVVSDGCHCNRRTLEVISSFQWSAFQATTIKAAAPVHADCVVFGMMRMDDVSG